MNEHPHRRPAPKWWRDPGLQAMTGLAALLVAGLVMLALGWRGSARTQYASLQMPWLISGGFAGLAIIGLAMGAWNVHLGRRIDAAHQAEFGAFIRETAELAEGLRTGGVPLPPRLGDRLVTR